MHVEEVEGLKPFGGRGVVGGASERATHGASQRAIRRPRPG
eukprot:CAMPEP_0180266884 /NCGR_PEP_ID=MMETSP0988-20121125/1244_1 /TAXON_ID=697907 /ORGANISM="non described non described, Strain CCMP2293" /LENGTH=40 /DNA_ID= /DNA_START= /DNA_END= /DNA_ORIENTATION=